MAIDLKQAIKETYPSKRDIFPPVGTYYLNFSRDEAGHIVASYLPSLRCRKLGYTLRKGKFVSDPNFLVDLSDYFFLIYGPGKDKSPALNLRLNPVPRKVYDEFLKKRFKEITLIDLGCGTGEKASYFYEHIKSRKKDLVLVDLSLYSLFQAQRTLAKTNEISGLNAIKCSPASIESLTRDDFEDFWNQNFWNQRIFLLLGRTIENFVSPSRILSKISKNMNRGDLLLVEGSLYKEKGYYERFAEELKNHPFCKELGSSIETRVEVCVEGEHPPKGTKDNLAVALANLKEDRPDYKLRKGYNLLLGISWTYDPELMKNLTSLGLHHVKTFKRIDKRCKQENAYLSILKRENIEPDFPSKLG